MKQILRFAKAKGYIERNPFADTLRGDLLESHVVTNFARIEPKDLPGLLPKNPTMSNGSICKALEGMGYKGEMTGHGFKGVASTITHECENRHEYIEAQMAHQKKDKVSGAYDHTKDLILRTYMMQDWADLLYEPLRSRKYKLIPPSYKIEREQRPEDDLRIKKREKANPEISASPITDAKASNPQLIHLPLPNPLQFHARFIAFCEGR